MKPSDSRQDSAQGNNRGIEDKYFAKLKSEDHTSSFPETVRWISGHNINKKPKIEGGKFSTMKDYILMHKMRLVYTVILLAVLIGACSMPVTTHETVGYVMSWAIPAGGSADAIENLPWIDKDKLSISENTDDGKQESIYTLVLPAVSEKQLQSYQKDLEKIKDVIFVKVAPLNENVKRPVYSAALNTFFRINIDATKMSDEELKNEVKKQLESQGFGNVNIDFKSDANGRRMIRMKIDSADIKNAPGNFEMRINDGGNEEVMKTVKLQLQDLQGKTDEEIRKQVKQDLNNPDLQDKDIQIIRENGKVKVKVEVEKNK